MGDDIMNKVVSRRLKQFEVGITSLHKLINLEGQIDGLLFKENGDLIHLEKDGISQVNNKILRSNLVIAEVGSRNR